MLRLLTREPADHHNKIPANHLLWLHRPQQHITNWANYFFQKLDKVYAQHNNTIQHPMLLMPLIYHLVAWRLDKTSFGFANRNRAELQELVPQSESKKPRVEATAQRTTRSQKQEQPLKPEEQRKQEEDETVEKWQKITEEHHKEKEAEERRRAKE